VILQSIPYIAGALVALFACYALYRLGRALARLEAVLLTADEKLREVFPEVIDGLGTVNDIAAGVNVGLRTAGMGAERLTEAAARSSVGAAATLYGVRAAAGSLLRSFAGLERTTGGQPDGR
jgi:hypothetical protein